MLEPDTIKRILELRKAGKSLNNIAQIVDIDKKTVRKYCVVYGVDGVDYSTPHWTEEEEATIKDLYFNKGMTPSEIAREMNKSYEGVRKYILRHNYKKPRDYMHRPTEFSKELPEPVIDPVYYPERKITPKKVTINGKKYQDMSEVFGL
jgi:DNA-binding CsgD family transcriptional regulator